MKDINSYAYFNKGLYLYKNHLNEWAVNSKNDNCYLKLFDTKQAAINFIKSEYKAIEIYYLTLDDKKLDILKGFYASLYNANFNQGSFNSYFWAEYMDSYHISWFVQNGVSSLAQKRESNFKYLKPQIETIWNEWLEFFNSKKAA